MTISNNRKKHLIKFDTFTIKALDKPEVEGTLFILIQGICEKPAANIILSAERLKAFSSDQTQDKDFCS